MRVRTGDGVRLAVAIVLAAAAAMACAAELPGDDKVRVQRVEVVASTLGPVILLKVDDRAVPVSVDQTVAESIHAVLTHRKLPRPLTHDLMREVLQAYGGKVTQVVVTLRGTTFYGSVSIELGGEAKEFDSRSSDAIALAIHFSAPILVPRSLLESAGRELGDPPGSRRL